MIIKEITVEKFRAFEHVSFVLGKRLTAIAGRNATQKSTVLGMLGQPFTISSKSPLYGCKTIDGYNFRSQFQDKFKISPAHDPIGEHRWTLKLNEHVCGHSYYTVESIARRQAGKEPTLRFWNAESRARDAGYIQLPVYFLSMSRLFPIGEVGKTKPLPPELSADELEYCVNNYRTILSIHSSGKSPTVGLEKGASRIFAGVNDDVHDIFTNSSGEGNIMRIILAVLSFKRLQAEYGKNYKGGILLIDELDATLYTYAQKRLVDYLFQAAGDYNIQIIFTTHSPFVLERVNEFQRKELMDSKRNGKKLHPYAYKSAIVYLEPELSSKRTIHPKNIYTNRDLKRAIADIDLTYNSSDGKQINVYCEDSRASAFVQYVLSEYFSSLGAIISTYMSFIDVDLGWTNYLQLVNKKIPEFCRNMIILDSDVRTQKDYKKWKATNEKNKNVIVLPLTVEKDIFTLLKDNALYAKFQETFLPAKAFSYEVCFRDWPLEVEKYSTDDFKAWYQHIESSLGEQEILFKFWCDEHKSERTQFLDEFIQAFDTLAEQNGSDVLPLPILEQPTEENAENN